MYRAPVPGSAEELEQFQKLQRRLPDTMRAHHDDPAGDHLVVVVPSTSFDPDELAKIHGVGHYEERLLVELLLLRRPRTHVVYCTSTRLSPTIVDYYLHLLTGVPHSHSGKRLHLLSCDDGSKTPLTAKLLARPRLLEAIRAKTVGMASAHIVAFNSTGLERSLAVQLDIPLFGNDPELDDLGSKSGGREVFREAGVLFPDGYERLRDTDDVVRALAALKGRYPQLRRAVIKLEEGFSGEGNAVFSFDEIDGVDEHARAHEIAKVLPERLRCVAATESWDSFSAKFETLGAVVEAFVDLGDTCSPSAQFRVDPVGVAHALSTHDQVLGGESMQVYQGSTFPAAPSYRRQIQDAGQAIADVLAGKGVIGRLAVDFVTAPVGDSFESYAIEINLRKGGTTHPMLLLDMLADGTYDTESGEYRSAGGTPRCYYATDTIEKSSYRGLSVDDLVDIAVRRDLHFDPLREAGVVFHMLGALSEFGKFGMTSIAGSVDEARDGRVRTEAIMDEEVARD